LEEQPAPVEAGAGFLFGGRLFEPQCRPTTLVDQTELQDSWSCIPGFLKIALHMRECLIAIETELSSGPRWQPPGSAY
jgi:hypothetical protein